MKIESQFDFCFSFYDKGEKMPVRERSVIFLIDSRRSTIEDKFRVSVRRLSVLWQLWIDKHLSLRQSFKGLNKT